MVAKIFSMEFRQGVKSINHLSSFTVYDDYVCSCQKHLIDYEL
jgi:hypothetical protein